jgi:hypothetical protein
MVFQSKKRRGDGKITAEIASRVPRGSVLISILYARPASGSADLASLCMCLSGLHTDVAATGVAC